MQPGGITCLNRNIVTQAMPMSFDKSENAKGTNVNHKSQNQGEMINDKKRMR